VSCLCSFGVTWTAPQGVLTVRTDVVSHNGKTIVKDTKTQ
jgi:hypothetical protein